MFKTRCSCWRISFSRTAHILEDIKFSTESGKTVSARGVRRADGSIWVRADHERFSASQLYAHERFHGLCAENPGLLERTSQALFEKYGAETVAQLAAQSDRAYAGTDLTPLQVAEEYLADAYAGMDDYGARASAYGEDVRQKAEKKIGGLENGQQKGENLHGEESGKGVFRRTDEQSDAFSQRISGEGYNKRTIAGNDYWGKAPVLLEEAKKTATCLTILGCKNQTVQGAVYHNNNGVTTETTGAAVTLSDGSVLINNDIPTELSGNYTANRPLTFVGGLFFKDTSLFGAKLKGNRTIAFERKSR